MPSETFFCNEHPENIHWDKLAITWVTSDKSMDPKVFLSVYTRPRTEYFEPDGEGCAPPPEIHKWRNRGNYELERDTINKVIRVLRRARDQVYGRDE